MPVKTGGRPRSHPGRQPDREGSSRLRHPFEPRRRKPIVPADVVYRSIVAPQTDWLYRLFFWKRATAHTAWASFAFATTPA